MKPPTADAVADLSLFVAALTQGQTVPSTRFRWAQYVSDLQAAGISTWEIPSRCGAYAPASTIARPLWLGTAVCEGLWRALRSRVSEVCFLQRNLVATLCTWEPLLRQPFAFDVDDAIFVGPRGASADRIARRASVTICGNSFLANHFAVLGKVEILPTAVDTDRFVPCTPRDGRPVIGWSGSSSGFAYLLDIEPAVQCALDRFPDAIIKIVSDRKPDFRTLPGARVVFEPWHPDTEVTSLQSFTVGLMPLRDTPWARGKCSFKMLTYMAVGVPVVVSPVGMNNEVLAHGACGYPARTHDEWVDAISSLIANPNAAADLGRAGRSIVETQYARRVIGPRLAQILKGML